MLTHDQIANQDLIEQYVRHQLSPEEAAAVEEHYFHCDACFESVRVMREFVAGVRYAARRGWLDPSRENAGWLFPAFGLATAAALLVTVALGWLWFVRLPDREAKLSAAVAQTRLDQARLAELDQRASLDRVPDPNVPVAILTADRAAGAPSQLKLEGKPRNVLLWIDAPQAPAGAVFHLVLSAGNVSKSIGGVIRNSNGALAVAVPSSELADGDYTVRVFRDDAAGTLFGEYRLRIARR